MIGLMGGLAETFDKSRLTTAAARIADVAKDHTYTIIGDPDHTQAATYEIIANPETMHALASVGVQHIATEMFVLGDQQVLDAYHQGVLSDRTMEYVVQKMSPPSLTQDGLGLDDTHQRNAYYDIVRNAKAEGIQVHGINGSEGVLPPELIEPTNQMIGEMKYTMALAIENNPDFFDMDRRAQGDFMTKQLYDNGFNDDQVILGLEMTGFRRQSFLDLADEDRLKEILIERLNGDPLVTDRIQNVTGGENTVVIYGQLHMMRPTGDIDGTLPDSAVIDIYRNQTETEGRLNPSLAKAAQEMGMDFSDRGDFQLDVETGKWTTTETGVTAIVEIPDLPSAPELTGREPIPPVQTPALSLPDIKF